MADKITDYAPMGFRRVCRVRQEPDGSWYYTDIDRSLMFSKHNSWIYMITVNASIIKIGETGNPLGIEPQARYGTYTETQPKTGSESRLGRYRKGDQTDSRCRDILKDRIAQGDLVEFWARRCPRIKMNLPLHETTLHVNNHHHKDLELALLDYYVKNVGRLPELNLSRK